MKYLLPLILLSGCASSPNYELLRLQAEAKLEAQINESKRLDAIRALGEGSDAARVAGIMALMQQQKASPILPVANQRSWGDYAMQALGLAVQVHGINKSAGVAIAQSNNSRDVSIASYNALSDVAGQIQAPSYTYTASGDGSSTGGSGNWGWEQIGPDSNNTTGNTAIDNTSTPTVVFQPAPVIVAP